MKKRDQELLKLMPLDEFGKLVTKIASVPKDAIAEVKPPSKGALNQEQPRKVKSREAP